MTTKEVTTDAGKKVEILLLGDVPEESRKKAIAAFERSDDQVVVNGLATGSEAGSYLYAYKDSKDKVIVGLSLPGTRALFEETHPDHPIPDVVEVVATAYPNAAHTLTDGTHSLVHGRRVTIKTPDGIHAVGEVAQPEYGGKRDGGFWHNEHAIPQALSKATRNAMRNAVALSRATAFLKKLVDEWVGQTDDGEIKKRKEPRSMGKVKVLTEKDSKPPASNDPARIQLRSRLFMLAGQAGLDVNKNRAHQEGTIAFVEGYLGVKLSEAPDMEIKRAGDYLDTPEGRAALKAKVVGS